MNMVDMGILGAVLVPGLLGLKTGIIRILFTLGGIGAGIYLAMLYYGVPAGLLGAFVEDEGTASALGFAIILVAATVASWILATFMKKALSFVLLGWVDNVAGALAGASLGGALAAVGVFLLAMMPSSASTLEASVLAPFFDNLTSSFFG